METEQGETKCHHRVRRAKPYLFQTAWISTHQPSESWALTSQPKLTRKVTMSKCPAHIALCSAVIPSSLAALGLLTCEAVRRTSSNSP